MSTQIGQQTETHSSFGLLCLVDNYDLEQIVNLLCMGVTGILSREATEPELLFDVLGYGTK